MLGFFSYCRAYVKDLASLAKPLTDLTSKQKPSILQWGESEQHALDALRRLVCEAPVCSVPVLGRSFLLYTDSSAFAVGCQLAQLDDQGSEHPIEYASHKLSPSQSAWAVIEREAFAVVWALGRFRNIIFGSQITVYTDNPLSYLCNNIPKSAKLTRWAFALQQYDLSVKYTRGCCNSVADFLSRINT